MSDDDLYDFAFAVDVNVYDVKESEEKPSELGMTGKIIAGLILLIIFVMIFGVLCHCHKK